MFRASLADFTPSPPRLFLADHTKLKNFLTFQIKKQGSNLLDTSTKIAHFYFIFQNLLLVQSGSRKYY